MARVEPRQAAELTATMSDAGTMGATHGDSYPLTEIVFAPQCAAQDEAILEVPMPASMTKGGACRTRDWSAVSGFTKMLVLGLNRVRRPMRQVLAVLVLVVGCGKSSDPRVATPPVITFDCTGNVAITTSAEMIAFAAQACTSVTGTLFFKGGDLTSVNLPALTTVRDLDVSSTTALTTFSLPALTTISGYLSVQSNTALTSLTLPGLTTIGRDLLVANNSALTSLTLPGLTTFGGYLLVANNTTLTSFSLPALTTVRTLDVSGNPALTSLSLPALTTGGDVSIEGNAGLVTVNVPALKTVSTSLTIMHNGAYSQCRANAILAHLEAFTGRQVSYGNYEAICMPTFLCGSDVWITNDAEMAAFAEQGCTSVAGTLSIIGLELTSFSLPALTSVGGLQVNPDLLANSSNSLTTFSLPALTTVAGNLSVFLNDVLTSFRLPALTTVGGELNVWGNSALTSFNLPALTTVGGDLVVESNITMTSISLPALNAVSTLSVHDNGALTSLTLPVFTTAASLELYRNVGLVTVNVPALKTVSSSLTITGNGAYSQCLANGILAHLEALTGGFIFYGNDEAICTPTFLCGSDVWITNNAEAAAFAAKGCTSVTGTLFFKGEDLTSVNLPALTTVGSLSVGQPYRIGGRTALTNFSLPALTTIGGDLFFTSDYTLTNFSLPALTTVGGALEVFLNNALTSFSLPALTTVGGGLEITRNPAMPQCFALAFKDHMVAAHGFTGPWAIASNNTTATCPP
jgi:hypothetical protein